MACCGGGGAHDVVGSGGIGICQLLHDMGKEGRLVAFSAVGSRGQIRSIGFQYDALQGYGGGQCLWQGGFFESHDTTDAKCKTGKGREQFLGFFGRTTETMEHASRQPAFKGQHGIYQRAVGGTCMYGDGQSGAGRPFQLPAKHLQLLFQSGVVPIEIQSDFPYCHEGGIGCHEETFHLVEGFVGPILGYFRRVQAHHGMATVGMLLAESHQVRKSDEVDGRQQHVGDVCSQGALQGFFSIGCKFFGIDVGMRINHFRGCFVGRFPLERSVFCLRRAGGLADVRAFALRVGLWG